MELKVLYGQDIFYLSNKTYGIDSVYKLLKENDIESIDFDFDENPQQVLEFDPVFRIKISPQLVGKNVSPPSEIQYLNAVDGQSIFDLVTQAYFDLGQVYKFIKDNDIANINQGGFNGQTFTFNTNFIDDRGLYDSFVRAGKIISTGDFVSYGGSSTGSFILRQDGGYLLRQDGGRFPRQ